MSADIVSRLPPGAWINSWTLRLQAEKTARDGVESSLGFFVPAEPGLPAEGYSLEIRRAITRFSVFGEASPEGGWNHLDAAVELSRAAFTQLVDAQSQAIDEQDPAIFNRALASALADGTIPVMRGTAADVLGFFQHFDPTPTQIVPVTIHPPVVTAR